MGVTSKAFTVDFFWNYEEISKIPGATDNLLKKGEEDIRDKSWGTMILEYFMNSKPSHWIFLTLVALGTATIGIGIESAVHYIFELKTRYWLNLEIDYVYKGIIWVTITVLLTMVAASVGEISKDAEGSGIPEMKSILAGVNIYRYLSFRTTISKIVGLTAGLAAGLSIGREGPFVHLAGGVTHKLADLRWFREIKENLSLK